MRAEVERLLEEARDRGGALPGRIASLRGAAVRAIRTLEGRLTAALGGGTLRGLVDLCPGRQFYGANLRGTFEHGIDTFLPRDGRPVLCIGKRGGLQMASTEGSLLWWVALDADLRVEDLEAMVWATEVVLRRHLDRVPNVEAGWARVESLARRLAAAFEGEVA